jgi:hypothetical protein
VPLAGPDKLALQKRLERLPPLKNSGRSARMPMSSLSRIQAGRAEQDRGVPPGVSGEQPLCSSDPSFIALASDRHFDLAVPCFDLNDARGIAGFILGKLEL